MAAPKKQPFMPLFFGDFLASTAEWSGEERSLYLTLLGYQWSLGSLPTDPAKLCRLVGWDRKIFAECWPQVASKFEERDGRNYNPRLELHREKSVRLAEKNRAAGKAGAEARWPKDGERHPNATDPPWPYDGERHPSAIATLNGNPSHPIPSHGEYSPETSSRNLAGEVAASAAPAPTKAEIRQVNGTAKRQRRGALGHFVPEDFSVPEDDYRWALEQGYASDFVARETERFCDHEFKSPRSDWVRAWRNWISRDPPGGRHAPQKRAS